jgi:multidrug resistance protein, MATE family
MMIAITFALLVPFSFLDKILVIIG